MDIKQLNYFVSVVDYDGFSNAARNLFITQPTLSQSIKKLEAELNTPLLTQSSNGIRLTEAGKILYDRSLPILSKFEAMIQEIKQLQEPTKETIRVGLPTLFAMQLMPIFSKFMISHPTVELTLFQGGSYDLQKKLANKQLDVGILSFPKYEATITLEPIQGTLNGYNVCVVMHKDHPLATQSSVLFKDLVNYTFSSWTSDFMLGRLLIERTQELGYTPQILYSDNNWEVLLSSVKTLDTICLMASEYQAYSSDENIAWIPLEDKKNFFPIGIGTNPEQTSSQQTHELIQFIQKQLFTS